MTKSIVTGLLAFAVSSSLALAQDPAAAAGGWTAKAGSGIKYDGGDAFSFNMANQLHVQWAYTDNEDTGVPDTNTNTFTVNRARTTLWGHVFHKNIQYKLKLAGEDVGASIKDAHVTWNFVSADDNTIGLRMGQGKVLFGLEGTGTSTGLFFTNRSAAALGFAGATRSQGAWIVGAANQNKLRWSVGAMNGDVAGAATGILEVGEETANADNELSFTGMVNFDPMGDITEGKGSEGWRQGDFREGDRSLMGTIGVGVAVGNGTGVAGDVESTSLNFNTAWSVQGFQVMGDFYLRGDDPQVGATDEEEPIGWAISGTYVLPKSGDSAIQWGFGVRLNVVESDAGATGSGVAILGGLRGLAVPAGGAQGEATEVSVVADAFYHGHAAKTQIEYTWQDIDFAGGAAGDNTNHILTIAFQLLF